MWNEENGCRSRSAAVTPAPTPPLWHHAGKAGTLKNRHANASIHVLTYGNTQEHEESTELNFNTDFFVMHKNFAERYNQSIVVLLYSIENSLDLWNIRFRYAKWLIRFFSVLLNSVSFLHKKLNYFFLCNILWC